jgi:hypothetical protein
MFEAKSYESIRVMVSESPGNKVVNLFICPSTEDTDSTIPHKDGVPY